jgi:hypothetical protein
MSRAGLAGGSGRGSASGKLLACHGNDEGRQGVRIYPTRLWGR